MVRLVHFLEYGFDEYAGRAVLASMPSTRWSVWQLYQAPVHNLGVAGMTVLPSK